MRRDWLVDRHVLQTRMLDGRSNKIANLHAEGSGTDQQHIKNRTLGNRQMSKPHAGVSAHAPIRTQLDQANVHVCTLEDP